MQSSRAQRCFTPPHDQVRLRHIVDAAHEAITFAEGASLDHLRANRLLLYGLVRCIEVTGEAASQVSEETRALLPGVPWRAATAMRNRLIHAYFDVDSERVWHTVVFELPPLVEAIEASGLLGDDSP